MDYEPLAYGKVKIDYEYILSLIQDIVSSTDEDEEEFKSKNQETRGYIDEPLKKPKARSKMIAELEEILETEVAPLQIGMR